LVWSRPQTAPSVRRQPNRFLRDVAPRSEHERRRATSRPRESGPRSGRASILWRPAMAITISGGKKATKPSDPVTVTLGATADVGDGVKHRNSIAIQFSGTECHVIQIFMRTKVVGGKDDTETIGVDAGGFNTFKFSTEADPDWLVDTTSAASPYYDFGYAGG